MAERVLPTEVVVMEGTDLVDAWDRFEVFDALHHLMPICNPMTDADLDAVLDRTSPKAGDSLLDVACGHGELVIRAVERTPLRAVGVDLSPWALVRCVQAAGQRPHVGSIEWRLGDAHDLPRGEGFEIVTCLGASWIWHGFRGTAEALISRTVPGGSVAIGDLRLREGADGRAVSESYGRVLTVGEQRDILEDLGIEIVGQIDAGPSGWDAYQDRILESVQAWAHEHPGDRAAEYLHEQRQWRSEHERDREFLDWTVWVGRKPA